MKSQSSSLPQAIATVLRGFLRAWVAWAWLVLWACLAAFTALVASRDAIESRPPFDFVGPAEIDQSTEVVRIQPPIYRSAIAERTVWLWPPLALIGGCVTALVLAEHFGGYRWRLVPGYRPVCLVAGAIFGAASFLISGLLVTRGSPQWPGLSGLALLAFALGCWVVARPWTLVVYLGLLVVLSPLTGYVPDSEFARVLAAAANWPNALCCAAAAGCLLVWFVVWLVNYNEDYPCFAQWRTTATAIWRSSWGGIFPTLSGSAAGHTLQGAVPLKEGRGWNYQDWWLERSLRRGPRGFAWTVRRWTLGPLPIGPEVTVLSVCVALAVLDPLFSDSGGPFGQRGGILALIIMQVCGLFLFRMIGFQRRPTLAVESLRPVTRGSWLRQSAAVVLLRLVGSVALLAMAAAFLKGPPTVAGISTSLACWLLALSILFLSVALIAWLRTVGPLALQVVVACVGVYAFVFVAMVPAAPDEVRPDLGAMGVAVSAAVIVGFCLASVALLRLAYRRWLLIDLE